MTLTMRTSYVILFLGSILCSGCKTELDKFREQAAQLTEDGALSHDEVRELILNIDPTEEEFTRFLNDAGVVDTLKVTSYLVRYFAASKETKGAVEVWEPTADVSLQNRFNVNVYVENSASMDGYVKGVTEFESAMYNLMADIKLSKFCDSLNLNYINSAVISNSVDALAPDIEDFISKLEPNDFKIKGGTRGTTDIKEILRDVLGRVNDRNLAVLISDFVFSPGKNKDATEYLEQQQVGIRIDIAQKMDTFDLALAVVQLESQFDGFYYDRNNTASPISRKRPYYVWLIGSQDQIQEILRSGILRGLKNRSGYKNLALYKKGEKGLAPAHGIQHAMWKEGMFDRDVSKGITGAEWDRATKHFGFSVAVDMSSTWEQDDYLVDTMNYRVDNPRYQLRTIKPMQDDAAPGHDASFTHVFELRTVGTEPLSPDDAVQVELLPRMPKWVLTHTSVDDTRIISDPFELGKTFGFKYLMDGVFGAFHPDPEKSLVAITVPIKKK